MTSLDVHTAFLRLATQSVTLTRYSAGSYDSHGRWVDGSSSQSSISASVQPLSGLELQDLPENRRTDETIAVYSETEIKEGSIQDQRQPDIITHDGKDYEVQRVESWLMASTPYYKALCSTRNQEV